MRSSLLRASLLALALALFAVAIVDATHTLRALRPDELKKGYNFEGSVGAIYSEPSLFGLPNYQAELTAMVKIDATTNDNVKGCNPYDQHFNDYVDPTKGAPKKVIALVERDGCSFGKKALMAQQAGASALIVYSTSDDTPLPKMAGGEDTPSITIPGMLVTKSDGEKLLDAVAKWAAAVEANDTASPYYDGVWASLKYELVAPDGRVEIDLYTYPDEGLVKQFLGEFADVASQLGEAARFEPHYRIMDGDTYGCRLSPGDACIEENLPCGSQCTNCGRYCRIDPNGDLDKKPDGLDIVQESARAKCVWQHSVDTNQPTLWWRYVEQRTNVLQCIKAADYSVCSKQAMRAVGMSEADIAKVGACTGNLGYDHDHENELMEVELDWAAEYQPLTSPYLFVNNLTYYGGFGCPAPADPASCGPLSMVCQGYAPGTAPALCRFVNNGCEAGVERDACGVCGGSAKEGDSCRKSSGFPVGPVIGILILCCALIGGAVYWYMRRQNNRMKDDIDNLLRQYLPLDGSAAATNGNIKAGGSSVRGGEPSSNLRLIGNLDSADEPTDL